MMQKLSISDQLMYSTVRIECYTTDGSGSTGTGFFFEYEIGEHLVPVIVTNKHVVENATVWRSVFTLADDLGNPLPGEQYRIEFPNFNNIVIPHPDDSVDLCVIPLVYVLQQARSEDKKLFYCKLDKSILPSDKQLIEDFTAIEDITMIGYPNGLWDSINNLPITRRGITATHPNINHNGKEEFLIDAACFPGSSGSPVFILNQSGYSTRNGNIMMGSRVVLAGILYAGPQMIATGEIRVMSIPTTPRHITTTNLMMNLGIVIKSSKLMDFEPILAEYL